ncbi:MAG: hypothetical protein DMG81_20785, partial [Acidobacteria bacterium]
MPMLLWAPGGLQPVFNNLAKRKAFLERDRKLENQAYTSGLARDDLHPPKTTGAGVWPISPLHRSASTVQVTL